MGLFGIGDGKMELQVYNPNVSPGQKVEGTATLALKKDVKGKVVVAILYAIMTEFRPGGMAMNGNRADNRTNVQVYENKQDLDGEKPYTVAGSPYTYRFSFVLPQTVGNPAGAGGGELGKLAGMLGSAVNGTIRWYVKAELKHENALPFPIEKRQEIYMVSSPQQGQV